MGTCTPWAKGGMYRWTVDHREQEERCHKLGLGEMVVAKAFQLLVHPLPTFCTPSPGTEGMPLSQRELLTFSGTECILSCHALCVLTSLICGIRPRLPTPGLFLLSEGLGPRYL